MDLEFLADFLKHWKYKWLSFSNSTFIETLELQLSLVLGEMFLLLTVFWVVTERQNWFQREGAMEHWKVLPDTMVDQQERVLNFRHSRMTKTVTSWLWWQPFNSFCFETLPFFSLFHFFHLAKKWGTMPPAPDVADPDKTVV